MRVRAGRGRESGGAQMALDIAGCVKKGTWTPEEDELLMAYVSRHGASAWNMARYHFPELQRTGKSCRLRYINQLRPGISRLPVSPEEELKILWLHSLLGNQWSRIASMIPGRSDNNVKNVVNMHLKKARRRAASLSFARAAAHILSPLNVVSATINPPSVSAAENPPSPPLPPTLSSAPALQALAALSSLYPTDSPMPQQTASSANWAALTGKLPSVQSFQSPVLGSQRSEGALPELTSLVQQQPSSFSRDMLEFVATAAVSFNNSAAGDVDLIEAVYSNGYGNSGITDGSSASGASGCGGIVSSNVRDGCSLNAISMATDDGGAPAVGGLSGLLSEGMVEPRAPPQDAEEWEAMSSVDMNVVMELSGNVAMSMDIASAMSSAWDSMPGLQ